MSMPSLVPAADRAPSLTSRVVTVNATDVTEGAPAPGHFTFSLPVALRVPKDDVILRPGGVKVRLVDGKAQVRLPVYSDKVQTVDGSTDWVIIVTPSWGGGSYPIRVPAGTSAISLADLPAVRPLTRREQQYAITGVGVTVTEGAQAGGSASYTNGQLDLAITVPPFRPETVYPYIDQTADARAEHYEARVREDLDDRLEEVTTAYELAVATGFEGTLDEWLDSLVGPEGPESTVPGPPNVLTVGEVTTGEAGSDAAATITGISPAQVLGLTIPRGDKGDKGDDSIVPGPTGPSAYDYAVENGFEGTEQEFADAVMPDTVTWDNIDSKPTEYPPETHTHPTSDITGLDTGMAELSGRLAALETDPVWVDIPYPAGVEHAGSGSPLQYQIDGNTVRLRGRVSPTDGVFTVGTGYVLATLPPEARPAYTQRTVFAGGSSTQWGRLEVSFSSGQINIAPISGDMTWADLSQTSWTLD